MSVMKSRFRLSAILVILVSLSLVSGCGSTSSTQNNTQFGSNSGKTIVFKAVTAWEENNIQSAGYTLFKKKLEELSNGRIKIQYAGGPEAIPAFNQGDAVRNGVVDFAVLSTAYYASQVPEAQVLNYSELTTVEEWQSGAMTFLNEIHNKKLNAQLLGRGTGMRYTLYTKTPINSISDFKGKRIRTSACYVPFIKALGAEAVIMQPGEIYTAIERGVIDGVAWPEAGITDLGLQKQVKYQIRPSFWKVDTVIIMNLDKWKQLAKDDQDLIIKAAREVEKVVPGEIDKYIENEQKKLNEAGIQEINLPEQEYTTTANNSAWTWMESTFPEYGPKLKEYFRKK